MFGGEPGRFVVATFLLARARHLLRYESSVILLIETLHLNCGGVRASIFLLLETGLLDLLQRFDSVLTLTGRVVLFCRLVN